MYGLKKRQSGNLNSVYQFGKRREKTRILCRTRGQDLNLGEGTSVEDRLPISTEKNSKRFKARSSADWLSDAR